MTSRISNSESAPAARPRRRWLQYGLRSLFVLTAVCAVLTYQGVEWYRRVVDEEDAIAQLRSEGADVRVQPQDCPDWHDRGGPPSWFLTLVGKGEAQYANAVYFGDLNLVPRKTGKFYRNADGSVTEGEEIRLSPTERHLRLMQRLPGIRHLKLTGDQIDSESFALLAGHPLLRDISIHQYPINIGLGEGLRYLALLPGLRMISIQNANFSDEGVRSLGAVTQLTGLNLPHCNLTDANVGFLANLINLEGLGFDCTGVTDDGLERLAGLKKLKGLHCDATIQGRGFLALANLPLEKLYVRGVVDDEGLASIAKIQSLISIDVIGRGITMDGVRQFRRMPNLKKLDIDWSLTEKELCELQKEMPNITIGGSAAHR